MTDQWTKARAEAVRAILRATLAQKNVSDTLDAALSALREHGYVPAPLEPSVDMVTAGWEVHDSHATPRRLYIAMITAAEKERE